MYKTVNKCNQTFLCILILHTEIGSVSWSCVWWIAMATVLEWWLQLGWRLLTRQVWGHFSFEEGVSWDALRANRKEDQTWRVMFSAVLEWWRGGQRSQRDVNVPSSSSSSSHVSWRATNQRSSCRTPPTVSKKFRVRMSTYRFYLRLPESWSQCKPDHMRPARSDHILNVSIVFYTAN